MPGLEQATSPRMGTEQNRPGREQPRECVRVTDGVFTETPARSEFDGEDTKFWIRLVCGQGFRQGPRRVGRTH